MRVGPARGRQRGGQWGRPGIIAKAGRARLFSLDSGIGVGVVWWGRRDDEWLSLLIFLVFGESEHLLVYGLDA